MRVVRKAGADPADPSDGTLVFSGTASSISDTPLTNGVDYHYAVWTSRSGVLSSAARITATPQDQPPDPVTRTVRPVRGVNTGGSLQVWVDR